MKKINFKKIASGIGRFFKNLFGQEDAQYPNPTPVENTPSNPAQEIPSREPDSIEGEASCSTNFAKPDWECLSRAIVLDNVNDSRYKTFLSRFFEYKTTHFEKAALRVLTESRVNSFYTQGELEILTRLIASLYYREDTSLSFKTALHNGETLVSINKHGTTIIPTGRGKGKNWTWDEAAHDAMMIKKSIFPKIWTEGEALAFAEKFNGLGYRSKVGDKGLVELSPYIMSGTTLHDETGKYWTDGKYNKTAKEAQLGVAALMKRIKIEVLATKFTS